MELSGIYKKDKLYDIHSPAAKIPPPPIPEGYNRVAVLYEYPEAEELPRDKVAFMAKVIEAGMKLQPAHTLTANLSYSALTLQKLAEEYGTQRVVIFGADWISHLRNAHIDKNEICLLYGMRVLCTDTLDVINANDTAKKNFWGQLKKLF
ncbi:MAG: hypothetical protein JST76_07000 [Bacteroidetes bacterium]|nr:hypothetical protein [Bacteroidota bacterium]